MTVPDHHLWELGWGFSLRCLLLGHRWFVTRGTVTVWEGMDGLRKQETEIRTCSNCGKVRYQHSPAPYLSTGVLQ